MAEIKKKSIMGHSTRMIDRTADAGTRIKNVALKTRDAAQKSEKKEDSSPSAYASECTTNVSKLAAGKAAQQFYQRGKESAKTTQNNIEKTADAVRQFKAQQAAKTAKNQQRQGTTQIQRTVQRTSQAGNLQSARPITPQTPTKQATISGRKTSDSFGQLTMDRPQPPTSSRIRFFGSNGMASNRIVNRARSPSVRDAVRIAGRPGNTHSDDGNGAAAANGWGLDSIIRTGCFDATNNRYISSNNADCKIYDSQCFGFCKSRCAGDCFCVSDHCRQYKGIADSSACRSMAFGHDCCCNCTVWRCDVDHRWNKRLSLCRSECSGAGI